MPRSLRDTLRLVHLWLGLILCLPLVLLGLTGTILTFEHGLGGHAASVAQPANAAAIVAAAVKAAPPGQTASLYVPPDAPDEPATVRFGRAGRGGPGFGAMVRVDPATLAIVRAGGGGNGFLRTVHRLHGNLLLPGRDGRTVVGWLGVVMLAMGLSGIVIWWPRPGRWKAAFTVGRGAKGVRLHRELHGAVGIWSLIVFTIVSFTGVYIAFPETLGVLTGGQTQQAPAPQVQPIANGTPIDLDQVIALAGAALPGGTVRNVALPGRPDQPYRVSLIRPGASAGAPTATAYVDPWRAKIIQLADPASLPAGQRLSQWQRPIHEGMGLGPVWHVLVGLSGLLPLLFAVTGLSMWLLKRRAKTRMAARIANLPEAAE